jgi:hypothetical protein
MVRSRYALVVRMSFTPPENAVKEQEHGFQCCGSVAFEAWRAKTGRSFDDVLRLLGGGSKATLSKWRNSTGVPSAPVAAQLQEISDGAVPCDAWAWWVPTGEPTEAPSPASEKRPVAELPELKGSPAERARVLEQWLESRARSGHGLTLDLDRSVRALLSSIQAQVRAKPIPDLHEHPDWDATITLILGAIAKYPGAAKSVIDAIRAALPTQEEAA